MVRYNSKNNYKLTDKKKNATTKKNRCFIQAVISSNYADINQQKLLAVPLHILKESQTLCSGTIKLA